MFTIFIEHDLKKQTLKPPPRPGTSTPKKSITIKIPKQRPKKKIEKPEDLFFDGFYKNQRLVVVAPVVDHGLLFLPWKTRHRPLIWLLNIARIYSALGRRLPKSFQWS